MIIISQRWLNGPVALISVGLWLYADGDDLACKYILEQLPVAGTYMPVASPSAMVPVFIAIGRIRRINVD